MSKRERKLYREDRGDDRSKALRASVISGESFLAKETGGGFTKAAKLLTQVNAIDEGTLVKFDISETALSDLKAGTKISGLANKRPLIQAGVDVAKQAATQEYGIRL